MIPTVSRWRIIDGPTKRPDRRDGETWGAVIENANDPAQRRFIGAVLSRTILESDPATLPDRIREAIETSGLSAITPYLDEPEPPEIIIVSSTGIQPEVGQ
jgi:hypothetical protein